MTKLYNIFWILIDSARNFRTNVDKRGLPFAVEEISQDGIYFRNVVTSAPSTLMSVSSMFTSIPSVKLARNYNNFPNISSTYQTLTDILKKHNYQTYGVVYYKHGRETLGSLVGSMPSKFLPNGLSHNKNTWDNNDIFEIFSRILERKHTKPLFTYLHYNVRVDKDIDQTIWETVELIKKCGYYNNSIIIINSDHGYPLPDKGWDKSIKAVQGLPHDLLLHNDNILTPLVIRHPEINPVIENRYVSTLDITPTILGMLNINGNIIGNMEGLNLLTLIKNSNNNERILRCDNRFIGQNFRGTAIIKGDYKLIVYKFNNSKEIKIYNIIEDPKEKKNLYRLAEYKSIIDELELNLACNDLECYNHHFTLLHKLWNIKLGKKYTKGLRIGINIPEVTDYTRILVQSVKLLFPESHVDLKLNKNYYDLIINSIESEVPWTNKQLIKKAKGLNCKQKLCFENNGKIYKNWPIVRLNCMYIKRRLNIVYNYPMEIFRFIKRLFMRRMLNDSESRQIDFITKEMYHKDII